MAMKHALPASIASSTRHLPNIETCVQGYIHMCCGLQAYMCYDKLTSLVFYGFMAIKHAYYILAHILWP